MTLQRPAPGDRGRISVDARGTMADTVEAWNLFIAALDGVDVSGPTRKGRRSVAYVLALLGSWPEGRPLDLMRADALAGRTDAEPLRDIEARVLAAHQGDGPAILHAALVRARDDIAEWAATPAASNEALLPVGGPLGIVPLGTLVAASAYQLAVAARDLAPAGMEAPDALTSAGVRALVDSVGAVAAATRAGSATSPLSLRVTTPDHLLEVCAVDGDWRTDAHGTDPDRRDPDLPALRCRSEVLIDIASGRVNAPAAYARGDVTAENLGGLLRVATALAAAPSLPGGEALRTAVSAYALTSQAAGSAGRAAAATWNRLRGR